MSMSRAKIAGIAIAAFLVLPVSVLGTTASAAADDGTSQTPPPPPPPPGDGHPWDG